MSLLSTLLGSMANQASGYPTTGKSPRRMGNRHPSIAPYETLRCRDGLLAVACGNDRQFQRLATILEIPEAGVDERFAANAGRVANREALVALLEGQLARNDATHWEQILVAADVPAGRVADLATAFDRAERLGLAPTVPVGEGHPLQVAHPIRYSSMEPRRPAAPPWLAEHDTQVRDWPLTMQPPWTRCSRSSKRMESRAHHDVR